jgi:hypothetical protein
MRWGSCGILVPTSAVLLENAGRTTDAVKGCPSSAGALGTAARVVRHHPLFLGSLCGDA